jgi:hypothetical protein
MQNAGGQMILVAVLEDGWDKHELAANLGRVLDLNKRQDELNNQSMSILPKASRRSAESRQWQVVCPKKPWCLQSVLSQNRLAR